MSDDTTGVLPVRGTRLYYEIRGAGPPLLILPGGDGDAGRSRDLVDQLTDTYTVITYDRRGLSRSTMDDPARPATLDTHADDAHLLLAEVADEPARVLGSSFGGHIGLVLTARHPEQVHTLVAHEPGTPVLLPGPERTAMERAISDLVEIHREQGIASAMSALAALVGLDLAAMVTEPGLTPPHESPEQRAANLDFLLGNDMPALLHCTMTIDDIVAVRTGPARGVAAAGRVTPRAAFPRRCAAELAVLLGSEVAEFPGGHNGNSTHPRAFATRLRAVLATT
ncbi:alpha/beta hydrolase [Actinophytocola sp.]|uniref:alpha/beta fold hydrolase n=1 Tax=Actinophytocola sp. TaxID=1872138 RepID=UPI002D3741B1|nr:alpha/beta hydrolase [Actinophytocola sp.]HYQ68124.1 alpha/beta hydrolase [Actinophytocola sp.]